MYKPIYENNGKDKAVSPIIATILIVAITVVLAATLYAVIGGYGGLIGKSTPTAGVSVTTSGNTATVTINSVSGNLSFADLTLQVTTSLSTTAVPITFSSLTGGSANSGNVTVTVTGGGSSYLTGLSSFSVKVTGGQVSALKLVDTSTQGTVFSWPT